MQTTLRYWEYYNLTDTFSDLYERANNKENFHKLYDVIISRENILLAFRTIKANKGSITAGTDGLTINDFKELEQEQLVSLIQSKLTNHQPKTVRRVFIPKPNGDKRPLGIPCMIDRIIQQCFKQVLEPIVEAKFYKHSYGFRPLRSTHHAIARAKHLINSGNLHFVVDIDIKGFFDNVNHTLLLKQLWNMGIRDKKVIRIISKMLKAEIEGEGRPSKGTPQGGILSPLLSNIVLNDIDQWISGQWENFESKHKYYDKSNKYKSLKKSNLKEGYIVRYADDFKIFCRDWRTAQKWYHAVRLYLEDRLKLNISTEKSKIVNLRKRESEFLGFTIRAAKKGNKRVAYSALSAKKKKQLIRDGRERIKKIRKSPSNQTAFLYNSWVLGVHNYFNKATHVSLEFKKITYQLSRTLYNRLKTIGKYEYPNRPPPSYKKFYSVNYRTFKVKDVYLYPLANVKHVWQGQFTQEITPYTKKGRVFLYKKLKGNILEEISRLMESNIPNRSVEYLDNRLSRYSMKMGKCEITGWLLPADVVHCHHFRPTCLGGKDDFNNLRILHKDVHRLIHATEIETINSYITRLGISNKEVVKINKYRKNCNLEPIGKYN